MDNFENQNQNENLNENGFDTPNPVNETEPNTVNGENTTENFEPQPQPVVEDNTAEQPNQTENTNPYTNNYAYGGFNNQPQTPTPHIDYTPVAPVKNYAPASKGLRIFCIILAAMLVVTGSCTVGYVFGRKSILPSGGSKPAEMELESRPNSSKEMTAAQVYEKLNPSIVGIATYNGNGDYSEASGVVYSEDGYIVTNDHIYSEVGAPKFKVFTSDGKEYEAKYIAGDTISDLAVLKVDAKGLTPATFGNSNEIFFGENVIAVGRPSEATDASSITSGIISLTSRRVKTTSNYTSRLIQTDSAINPGSSGGALSDMFGHVIGITSSKLAGVQYDSIGFAIPTVTVKRVVTQLIANGKVTDRAKLGITYTEVNSVTAEIDGYKNTGLLINSVSEDSDIYGKVGEGDMITHINGVEITNDDVVLNIIEEAHAGDKVTLTVLSSKGTVSDYTVTLAANVGESSYMEKIVKQETPSEQGQQGGLFNFPFGN